MVTHVLIWLDRPVTNKDADDENLESVETDDTFERGEFEHNFMGRELLLLQLVEAETGEDSEDCGRHLDNRKPNMCEARLVGGATICADSKRNGGSYPYDDGDGKILKDHVPSFLGIYQSKNYDRKRLDTHLEPCWTVDAFAMARNFCSTWPKEFVETSAIRKYEVA